jgi:hypothetical protein
VCTGMEARVESRPASAVAHNQRRRNEFQKLPADRRNADGAGAGVFGTLDAIYYIALAPFIFLKSSLYRQQRPPCQLMAQTRHSRFAPQRMSLLASLSLWLRRRTWDPRAGFWILPGDPGRTGAWPRMSGNRSGTGPVGNGSAPSTGSGVGRCCQGGRSIGSSARHISLIQHFSGGAIQLCGKSCGET